MPQRLYIKKKHPERCQVPGCKNKGEMVVLDAMDGTAAEFECRLCEDHYAEARGVGQ